MKAVIPRVSERMLHERKATGADRWDEIWDGVLHMPPMPNRVHQQLEGLLEHFLHLHWESRSQGQVYHQINLASPGGWPDRDFRVPDLVLLTPDRFHIDKNEYFDGPPLVVVEIASPGDESMEKLDFYAELGVPEVWILERDTKTPSIRELRDGDYFLVAPDADGWHTSAATSVRMRATSTQQLEIDLAGDAATRMVIPKTR